MGRFREWLRQYKPPPLPSNDELDARATAPQATSVPAAAIPRINVHYPQNDCFCGCGRALGFGDKGVAKQGARVLACLEYMQAYALPIQEASSFDESSLRDFISDGEQFAVELAEVIHGDLPANLVDRGHLNHWLGMSQNVERALAAAMIRAGRA